MNYRQGTLEQNIAHLLFQKQASHYLGLWIGSAHSSISVRMLCMYTVMNWVC